MFRTILQILFISLIVIPFYGCDEPDSDDQDDPHRQEQISWPTLADTPWPMMGQNPQNTHRTAESGITSVSGFSTISSNPYFQAPIVVGEENFIYRVGVDTGYTVMESYGPDGVLNQTNAIEENGIIGVPTLLPDGKMYLPGDGKIWLIDGSSKQVLWEDATHVHPTRVTVGLDGELYFFSNDPSRLVSLTETGDLRWVHPNPGNSNMGWTAIAMAPEGDQLYFSSGTGIMCLSTNGDELWQYPINSLRAYLIMVDNDGNIFFYAREEESLVSLTSGGELRWQMTVEEMNLSKIENTVSSTIDFDGNLYYVARDTSNNRGVISLTNDGQNRWFFEVSVQSGIICDVNNHIYYGTSFPGDNAVGALSSEGTLLWEFMLGGVFGNFSQPPAINTDGKLIFPLSGGSDIHAIIIH